MKKILFLSAFFVLGSLLLTACDADDNNTYKFKGTVEILQYPEGDSLSLKTLADDYNSRIIYRAIVKDVDGNEISNITVSWGTENVSSSSMSFPEGRRMVINVGTEDGGAYTPGETISVKAAYGGVQSSSKTVIFII